MQKSLGVGGSGWRPKELVFELHLKRRKGRISIDIKREGRASGNAGSNISKFLRTQKRPAILELSIFNYSESNLIDLSFSDITWKVENEVCSLLLASGWHWT